MDIPRALLVNPLCAIRARKTKGFTELAKDVCGVVDAHHGTDSEVCAVAASTLWPAATLGGKDEVKAIIDAGGLKFLRRAMKTKGRSADQTRRLAGCIRALVGRSALGSIWDAIRRFAASGAGHAGAAAGAGAVAGALVGSRGGGPKPGTRVNRSPRRLEMGRRGARRGLAASGRPDVGRDAQGVARERRGAASVREKVREEAGRKKRWVVATSGNCTFTRRARRGRD